jgi:hypothetical protein
MHNNPWVTQIRGAPSIPAIAEFIVVWERIQEVNLGMDEDKALWKLTTGGAYSPSFAYQAFFLGRTRMMAAEEVWSAGAPLAHKLHV